MSWIRFEVWACIAVLVGDALAMIAMAGRPRPHEEQTYPSGNYLVLWVLYVAWIVSVLWRHMP